MRNFFDRMFRKEPAEDWRLVHTHELTWSRASHNEKGTVYAHFFESNKGNRYVKLISPEVLSWLSEEEITVRNHADIVKRVRETGRRSYLTRLNDAMVCEFVLTNSVWNETIYPWLAGRTDPKVPTYAEVPKREFAEALAGKKG